MEKIGNKITYARKNISTLESKRSRKDLMEKRENYFSQLGIILTGKCNIRCRHCMYNCQPDTKMELGWLVIERLIKEASAIENITQIHFTGGEPFLELDTLFKAVNLCKLLGLKVSVVTNGYWAVSVNVAKQILEKLDGLTLLEVSTDSFHQEFVSIDRIRNVILACNELGINKCVRVSFLNDPVSEIENIKKHLSPVEGLYELSQQPVLPIGRAASHINLDLIFSYDPKGVFCRGADFPLIISNGNVSACCGPSVSWLGDHPLLLGNIFKQGLKEISDAADLNPIIHILRLWGPSELVNLVKEQSEKDCCFFTPPMLDEIQNICSLCKFIIANPKYSRLLQRAILNPVVVYELAVRRMIELGEISMILKEV
jgi:MoaA/NifB/PqqE/SkfB family radical SAM enzyme